MNMMYDWRGLVVCCVVVVGSSASSLFIIFSVNDSRHALGYIQSLFHSVSTL